MNGFPHLANLIREVQLDDERARRNAARKSALAANSREYDISPESRAALERGDRQRATGVYEGTAATFFDWDDEDERQSTVNEWYFYSAGRFVEDLNKIQRLIGSALYEVVSEMDDKNYIRRVED